MLTSLYKKQSVHLEASAAAAVLVVVAVVAVVMVMSPAVLEGVAGIGTASTAWAECV